MPELDLAGGGAARAGRLRALRFQQRRAGRGGSTISERECPDPRPYDVVEEWGGEVCSGRLAVILAKVSGARLAAVLAAVMGVFVFGMLIVLTVAAFFSLGAR
jgi:hypothetical protein